MSVQVAEEMHGIGEVSPRMPARRFEQSAEIWMTSTSPARDARELGFGSAGLTVADGPIDRHSSPLDVRRSLIRTVLTQGRKDEVYGGVSFREPCSERQSSR